MPIRREAFRAHVFGRYTRYHHPRHPQARPRPPLPRRAHARAVPEERRHLPCRDSNKGIVTIRFEPYRALLDNMKPLNSGLYALTRYFDRR